MGWHRHRQLSAGKERNHLATGVATSSRWRRPHCFAAVPPQLRWCLRFDGSINAFEHARDGPGDPHALALVVLSKDARLAKLLVLVLEEDAGRVVVLLVLGLSDSGGGRSVSCCHHRLSRQLFSGLRRRYLTSGAVRDGTGRRYMTSGAVPFRKVRNATT